jgi:hypothetical protein
MNTHCFSRGFHLLSLALAIAATLGIGRTDNGQAGSSRQPKEVPGRVRFERIVIEPQVSPNGHKPKAIADLDGDGDADIVIWTNGQGLSWYEAPAWTKHPIHVTTAEGDEDAQAADIDNDGDLDIVISGVQWFENPLRQGKRPDQGPWKAHKVADLYSHDVIVGDIDHDGKIDIAASTAILLQRGPDDWQSLAQPQIERGGDGTALSDLDGDGDLDLLVPTPVKPYQLVWFENPLPHGKPVTDIWKKHVIAPGYDRMSIAAIDLNHDGRGDVIMAPMYQNGGLRWYEAAKDPKNSAWTEHSIDGSINNVHQGSIQVGDFDGDGNPDLALAEQEQSETDRLAVFYNLARDGLSWGRQILATTGGHNIKVGDVDSDGDPDILNANHGFFGASNPVELWRNRRNPIESGLRVGEVANMFSVQAVTGPYAGQTLCYRCKLGNEPVVCVFARRITAPLATLLKKLEARTTPANEHLKVLVVILTDDSKQTATKLKSLAAQCALEHVPLTLVNNPYGPEDYKIAERADVTILMWKGPRVRFNRAFCRGEMTEAEVTKVLLDLPKVLKD